jgi:hypothetical protein
LIPNQSGPGINVKGKMLNGGNQPPKNKILQRAHIIKILAYSPKKNKANPIAEYSVKYPATNSASASGKSKGARFVSAKIHTNQIITAGKRG